MFSNDDIRTILMNHEKRLTAIETHYKHVEEVMRGLEQKLQKIEEHLSGIRTDFTDNNSTFRKELITIISLQATSIVSMIMILAKIMGL